MTTTEKRTRITRAIESTERDLEFENKRLAVHLAAMQREIDEAIADLRDGNSVQPIDARQANEAITARKTIAHQLTVLKFVAAEDAETIAHQLTVLGGES